MHCLLSQILTLQLQKLGIPLVTIAQGRFGLQQELLHAGSDVGAGGIVDEVALLERVASQIV